MDLDHILVAVPLLGLLAVLIFRIPELGLVLCVVVGASLKGIVQPYFGSVDITLYLMVVTFFCIFVRTLTERTVSLPDAKVNVLVGLLLGLLLISLIYTPLPKAGLDKLARFALLTISMMYMIVMWCTSGDRIKRVLVLFVGVVLVYATVTFVLLLFVDSSLSSAWRANIAHTSSLGVAQLLACGILAALVLRDLVAHRGMRLLLDALTVVSVVELIALNSRGPVIAFAAGGICLFLLSTGRRRRALLGGAALVAVVVAAFVLLPVQYTGRYEMIADLTSPSVATRMDMWSLIGSHWAEWFLAGVGISGFAAVYLGDVDLAAGMTGVYPHNMFLDVFADAGFFALLAFTCLLGLLLWRGIRLRRLAAELHQRLALAILVPLVTIAVASLFSGDLVSTRPLWFFGGLVLCMDTVWKRCGTSGLLMDAQDRLPAARSRPMTEVGEVRHTPSSLMPRCVKECEHGGVKDGG